MSDLEILTENAALAHFRRVLGNARVDADLDDVRALCKAVNYSRLALLITLGILRITPQETLRGYATRLRDQTLVLRKMGRVKNSDLSVRASFDLSYASMSDEDKRRYRRLAVFASDEFCTQLAAQIIIEDRPSAYHVGEDNVAKERTREALQRFVDLELLTYVEEDRFRLDRVLKAYAGELLRNAKEDTIVWTRAMEAYLRFASDNSQFDKWNVLEAERENVLGILEWCRKSGHDAQLAEIAEAHDDYWSTRGYWQDQVHWLQCAIEVRRRLGPKVNLANDLHNLAVTFVNSGEFPHASPLLNEALRLYEQLGAMKGVAACLNQLGRIAVSSADYASASKLLERALVIRKELNDRRGVSATLDNLGVMASDQGNHGKARNLFEEAIAIRRELLKRNVDEEYKLEDKKAIAQVSHNLGVVMQEQGDYVAARGIHQQALVLLKELGNKQGIAASIHALAGIASKQGDYRAASDLYRQALAMRKELGDKPGVAATLHDLGVAEGFSQNIEVAETSFREGLKIALECGSKYWIAANQFSLARAEFLKGDLSEARRLVKNALLIWEEIGAPQQEWARQALQEIESKSR